MSTERPRNDASDYGHAFRALQAIYLTREMLPDNLSDAYERFKSQALRGVYGKYSMSALEMANQLTDYQFLTPEERAERERRYYETYSENQEGWRE